MALGEPRERGDLVGAGGGAVRVDRVDQADRARARRDRGRDPVGVEPVAGAGPERDRHRPAARGDDRGREMEVAGVADDDLVARVHGGHQRERQAGLRALGPDDLERRVAVAAEHGGARVAQRLDEVGRVHVERVGHHRVAHRLDRRRGRPAEARQPAEIGPVGRQPRRALGIEVVGLEADERDRVAVGDVVPHRVVAALQRAQALGHGERAGRGRVGRPGEDVGHALRLRHVRPDEAHDAIDPEPVGRDRRRCVSGRRRVAEDLLDRPQPPHAPLAGGVDPDPRDVLDLRVAGLDVEHDLAGGDQLREVAEVALDDGVVVLDPVEAELQHDVGLRLERGERVAVERVRADERRAAADAEALRRRARAVQRGGRDVAQHRPRAPVPGDGAQQVRRRPGGEVRHDRLGRVGRGERVAHRLLGEAADVAERDARAAAEQAAVDLAAERRAARRPVGVDVVHERPGLEAVPVADPQPLADAARRPARRRAASRNATRAGSRRAAPAAGRRRSGSPPQPACS